MYVETINIPSLRPCLNESLTKRCLVCSLITLESKLYVAISLSKTYFTLRGTYTLWLKYYVADKFYELTKWILIDFLNESNELRLKWKYRMCKLSRVCWPKYYPRRRCDFLSITCRRLHILAFRSIRFFHFKIGYLKTNVTITQCK